MKKEYCPVCQMDTNHFLCKTKVGDYDVTRRFAVNMRYTTNMQVCSMCGVMRLVSPHLDFFNHLNGGFPNLGTGSINVKEILEEMVPPGSHSEEYIIGVKADQFQKGELDDLSNGIVSDQYNYNRLIAFWSMTQYQRIKAFGRTAMPFVSFIPDEFGVRGKYIANDGRRRLSLLYHLGAEEVWCATKENKNYGLETL